jgi:hypothetical protein
VKFRYYIIASIISFGATVSAQPIINTNSSALAYGSGNIRITHLCYDNICVDHKRDNHVLGDCQSTKVLNMEANYCVDFTKLMETNPVPPYPQWGDKDDKWSLNCEQGTYRTRLNCARMDWDKNYGQ